MEFIKHILQKYIIYFCGQTIHELEVEKTIKTEFVARKIHE